MFVVWMKICSLRKLEVLTGPRDCPLRQTSPEMDVGSLSIEADLPGEHIGLNKTERRKTGNTCFVKI